MAISNVNVVNTRDKAIIKTVGKGGILSAFAGKQLVIDAIKLTGGTNESTVSLIECYYLIEGTGTLSFIAESEEHDLALRGKGKYGLRPNELKFGSDKQINISTDARVKSYLLVTEFRRNN